MTGNSIEAFYFTRQQQLTMQVHLHALVDGLLFADAAGGSPPQRSQAAVALFDGTPDASLADAGPWLLDHERAGGNVRRSFSAMAGGPTGVSWLISAYPIESLADELRRRLDVRLPDGRTALLRFYDARIMRRHDIADGIHAAHAVLRPDIQLARRSEWKTEGSTPACLS